MHDIVTSARTVDDARQYYAKEFLDARRGQPTPLNLERTFSSHEKVMLREASWRPGR
jgi:hypothetical protein